MALISGTWSCRKNGTVGMDGTEWMGWTDGWMDNQTNLELMMDWIGLDWIDRPNKRKKPSTQTIEQVLNKSNQATDQSIQQLGKEQNNQTSCLTQCT